jgi:hypothetical protein
MRAAEQAPRACPSSGTFAALPAILFTRGRLLPRSIQVWTAPCTAFPLCVILIDTLTLPDPLGPRCLPSIGAGFIVITCRPNSAPYASLLLADRWGSPPRLPRHPLARSVLYVEGAELKALFTRGRLLPRSIQASS